jgi:hypothetical protein
LTLDQNGIFGELYASGNCKEADKYVKESAVLLDAIKISNLTSLSLSKTGMGPIICSRLATSFSAVLNEVNMSGNPLTGGDVLGDGSVELGTDISGVAVLFPSMTAVITLNVSNCGLGPSAMPELSKLVRDASAVLASLTLDENGIFGELYSNGNCKEADKYVDESAPLLDAIKISKLTSISLSKTGMGPIICSRLATSLSAVVKKIALSNNFLFGSKRDEWRMIHDVDADQSGWSALCDALPGSPVEDLDVADVGMGVKGITSLAKAMSAGAALDEVNVSKNPIGVDGATALSNAIPQSSLQWIVIGGGFTCIPLHNSEITSLDVSDQQLGPPEVTMVAAAISTYAAVLASLNLGGNAITGSKRDHSTNYEWQYDLDLSGFSALCQVLGRLNEVNLSDCHLGPASMPELAKVFRDASAVLNSLNVSQNAIGGPCAVGLVDGAETGVSVKKSVFAAVDGRWGQVINDPDGDNEVKLTWLDDGTQSKWTKSDKLNQVVSSRADLVEDYSHIEQFGQAIARLTDLDISSCNFTPASIKIFTSSVTWAEAAIEKVKVSGCDVTPEAAAQLLTAANEASRARLRAHQVLAFSEALHARLGSECLLQAVALDTDVWRRVAENVRERHGHELMCSQLAQAGQTWFEVTVEGLIAEGVPR